MRTKHLYISCGFTLFCLTVITFWMNNDIDDNTARNEGPVFVGQKKHLANHESARLDIELTQMRKSQEAAEKKLETESKEAGNNGGSADDILILYWDKPWKDQDPWPPEGWRVDNCVSTYDQSRINEAKAVVFHYSIALPNLLPWQHYRDPSQTFVWWSAENPTSVVKELKNIASISTYEDLYAFDGFFNATMTYRMESDFYGAYGSRQDTIKGWKAIPYGKNVVDDLVKRKSNMAIAFISNCEGSDGAVKRMEYINNLISAGLSITTGGGCFPQSANEITDDMVLSHKFYLSFENTFHCRWYITEKFWDSAIRKGLVPVVWGAPKDDVTIAAPPGSFIHADDFETPAHLAEYLLQLDKDDEAYRKFFEWREDPDPREELQKDKIAKSNPSLFVRPYPAEMCAELNKKRTPQTIDSLVSLFVTNNPKGCFIG